MRIEGMRLKNKKPRWLHSLNVLVVFLSYPAYWILWMLKPIAWARTVKWDDSYKKRKTQRFIKEYTVIYFHKRWLSSWNKPHEARGE
jgi:hypothetical protein